MTTVAAFNADWTNRTEKVNTPEKLVTFLNEMVEEMCRPDAFSICECRLSTVTSLASQAHACYRYASEAIEYANQGHLALFYNSNVLRAVSRYQISVAGKYGFQRFEEIATKKKFVLACVHLPHKKGKAQARSLLKSAMDQEKAWADCIKIFGDFNAKPADLMALFPTYNVCIKQGSKTTKKGGTPDNFVMWEKVFSPGQYVTYFYTGQDELEHYPLLNVEETDKEEVKNKDKKKK